MKKRTSGILAGIGHDDGLATGVLLGKLGHVQHLVLDNDVTVVDLVVQGNLLEGELAPFFLIVVVAGSLATSHVCVCALCVT